MRCVVEQSVVLKYFGLTVGGWSSDAISCGAFKFTNGYGMSLILKGDGDS